MLRSVGNTSQLKICSETLYLVATEKLKRYIYIYTKHTGFKKRGMTYEKYKAGETVKSYSLAKLKVRARENIELLIITSGPRLAKQGRRWVYYKIVILVAPITNLYMFKTIFLFLLFNGRDANIVSTLGPCAPVTTVAGVKRR